MQNNCSLYSENIEIEQSLSSKANIRKSFINKIEILVHVICINNNHIQYLIKYLKPNLCSNNIWENTENIFGCQLSITYLICKLNTEYSMSRKTKQMKAKKRSYETHK